MVHPSVQTLVENFLTRIPGLLAVQVTDMEGVLIVEASLIEGDQSFLSQYVTTFAFSTEQANKLGLGPNKSITQVSESGNLVQLNASPLMITMYGEAHSDVGLMQTLGQELSQVLAPISAAVANLESQLEH